MNYIYPPRAETKITSDALDKFEKFGQYFAEPKLNGSSMQVYFSSNGSSIVCMNRHKEKMLCKIDEREIKSLFRGKGEMILCGEYLNKNKLDEHNKSWNNVYVIWDIIMFAGKHLLGTTYSERLQLLAQLYPSDNYSHYSWKISENIYRVLDIRSNFKSVFDEITKYDIFEGLVLKKINGKLEFGKISNNNTKTQVKCRKPTKNYRF